MSYTKNNWKSGDIVTANKLNHMEEGIANAGGVMVVHDNDGTLDKTWQEISDFAASGLVVVAKARISPVGDAITYYITYYAVTSVYNYAVICADGEAYEAESASDYPSGGGGGPE